jgi:glycosyltransferase involved in cell wall biosynthesis
MNILFFQYGDFGEAFTRFREGGPETYRDQRASVDFVASLRSQNVVTTIGICDREHKDNLDKNLWSIGIKVESASRRESLSRLLDDIQPHIIVCRTPNYYAIEWAKRWNVQTLLSFADFFSNSNPKKFLRNVALRRLLSARVFPCVANHNLNASVSVSKALFYPTARVVPWDWTRLSVAKKKKTEPADRNHPSAFFAGILSDSKGVGDCLEAVSLLRKRGIYLTFEFAGPGDVEQWRLRATELGVGNQVRFLGLIPSADVRERMVANDVVIVPSRHEYPEGLPNTIYEALASRTPLIISDHPAFASRLQSHENCLVFRAAQASSLADQIATLLTDVALFPRLSANSADAHNALYFGIEWTELVSAFLSDPRNRTGWVEKNSLANIGGWQR